MMDIKVAMAVWRNGATQARSGWYFGTLLCPGSILPTVLMCSFFGVCLLQIVENVAVFVRVQVVCTETLPCVCECERY